MLTCQKNKTCNVVVNSVVKVILENLADSMKYSQNLTFRIILDTTTKKNQWEYDIVPYVRLSRIILDS